MLSSNLYPPCLHVSPTFPTGPTPTWSHKDHPIKTSFAGKVGSHVAVLRGVPGPSFRFRSSTKAPNIRKALCFGTQVFQDSFDLTEICQVISRPDAKNRYSNYSTYYDYDWSVSFCLDGIWNVLFRISLTVFGVKYQIPDYREVTFKYVFRLVWLTCITMISMLACMDLLVGLDSKCITYLGCFRNPSTLIQHGPPPFPPPRCPVFLCLIIADIQVATQQGSSHLSSCHDPPQVAQGL